jgi:DNA-directed RNA polymerase subunit alpha
MLSSIQGAAITSVRIDGVLHEFQTIPGLKEDMTELLLNLKEICVRVEPGLASRTGKHILHLDRKGAGRVTGADIECPSGVFVVNPECYLATIAEESASLTMEMQVEIGRGYVLPEKQETQVSPPIGTIPVGAAFTPVRKVNYVVEPRRMGFKTDLEGLVIEVVTNGTIAPSAAISQASMILDGYFKQFMELSPEGIMPQMIEAGRAGGIDDTPLEELHLSPRAYNCLSRADIRTLGQLRRMSDKQLLDIKNFGQKSLIEVKEKLEAIGVERIIEEEEEAEEAEGAEEVSEI